MANCGDPSLRFVESHVITAEAGIHCSPDRPWTPAFAGVTRANSHFYGLARSPRGRQFQG
jgi:hypothetical protein